MMQSSLKVPMQDLLIAQQEQLWRKAGASDQDVRFAYLSGIDARDVKAFREVSVADLLIVTRCPKIGALAWHGKMPGKQMKIKAKTGDSGVVVYQDDRGQMQMRVSDYDLMSLWRMSGGVMGKIFVSAQNGGDRGKFNDKAQKLIVELNRRLVTRIQHGCQDDWNSPSNRGVKPDDQFAAFFKGKPTFLANPTECARFYRQHKLHWPYDPTGRYICQQSSK